MYNANDSINLLARYGIPFSFGDYSSNNLKTVVVGLSGGVDSSVSALLLRLMGYRVVGIHMKNWHTCNPNDYDDVVKIADALDIPYYTINLTQDYSTKVFDSFVADLNAGLTPNPDILCNQYIKFDVFLKHALLLGADFIATGHYAKIVDGALTRPVDASKDQTYFLHAVNPSAWSKVIFPLGNLTKTQVRNIARDFNLATASKKDSRGICFIDNKDFRSFISDYVSKTQGNFVDQNNVVLGTHIGLPFYTLGQKRGLDLKFKAGSDLAKKYSSLVMVVARKNLKDNSILLVPAGDPVLQTMSVTFKNATTSFQGPCLVRWRNLGGLVPAVIDGDSVRFNFPVDIIAPGQSVVFYVNDVVVGGALVR